MLLRAARSPPAPLPSFAAPVPLPFMAAPEPAPRAMSVPVPGPPSPGLFPPEGESVRAPAPALLGLPRVDPGWLDSTMPAPPSVPPGWLGGAATEPLSSGPPIPEPRLPCPRPRAEASPLTKGGGGTTLVPPPPNSVCLPRESVPPPPTWTGGGTTLAVPALTGPEGPVRIPLVWTGGGTTFALPRAGT